MTLNRGASHKEFSMPNKPKTAIITGASRGIGAGLVRAFLERGYSVVANARHMTASREFESSEQLALIDGDVSQRRTAERIIDVAISKFTSVDALVNNAGIFFTKPFTSYTIEDFRALAAINLEGFIHISQLTIKQMLAQKSGRCGLAAAPASWLGDLVRARRQYRESIRI
jgi:NAD(P)-dependent dehydrogenase (short-subunit alcohol dehydrogenase family)